MCVVDAHACRGLFFLSRRWHKICVFLKHFFDGDELARRGLPLDN
jgi:hypothetical protein